MLSLPLIAPQNEYTFFLSPHLRPSWSENDNSNNNNANNAAQQASHSRRQNTQPTRSSLAQLQADELAIATRKHNIRRFGAAWIKPPGVAKTLQAETEERAEREEQEAMQRREQMMMDMQAQQEAEEARQRAAEAGEGPVTGAGEDGEMEEERDLDEDIPDADVEEEEEEEDVTDSDEEEDEESEEDDEADEVEEAEEDVDVTFNEESLLENSFMPVDDPRQRLDQERYARLEEAELTGIAQDEADLGIERDLDDSVPEAGSYQHTDSELEDSDEEDEDDEDSDEQSAQEEQERSEVEAVMQRSRSSLLSRDVSSLLDSSFVTSSPVMGRLRSATHRANQR